MPVSVVSRVALVAALFLLSVTSSFSVSDRSIENFNNDSNMTAFTSTGGDNIEPLDSVSVFYSVHCLIDLCHVNGKGFHFRNSQPFHWSAKRNSSSREAPTHPFKHYDSDKAFVTS